MEQIVDSEKAKERKQMLKLEDLENIGITIGETYRIVNQQNNLNDEVAITPDNPSIPQ